MIPYEDWRADVFLPFCRSGKPNVTVRITPKGADMSRRPALLGTDLPCKEWTGNSAVHGPLVASPPVFLMVRRSYTVFHIDIIDVGTRQ